MANAQSSFGSDFLETIKQELLTSKENLEKELANFTTKNPKVPGDFEAIFPEYGDEEDENVREVAQYTTNKQLEMSLEKTLRDVVKSLERLEAGNYGICKYCDKPIDEKRLLARPTSGSCVDCKKTLTDEI